ncbi:sugar phosphate isomerase/epimerase [uncultured Tateyamaria sp.]|uniref:sugar phosphate isomerase/epimerase family protein n=1 Tax=uncultured Tateyamaria sp. TaxID=455651 RepID=UPI002606C899|nr:sugar phosphate isomerase/epimerase [uncultured Tateyamaria sp.]
MNVALQLYSMRDCADQIALLGELPAMGITKVEGYGGVYGDPEGYRAAMDANGVTMGSGHMGLADVEADFDGTVKLAKTLGMTRLFAPYLDASERPDTAAGYIDLAQRLNAASKRYADHGIDFGWHNHDFEFVALADGSVPMETLLDNAPDITWEADLAWIVRGGRDPMDYVQRYGNRMAAVHVKDIAAEGTNMDEDGWCDLSAGTMDWAALLQACRGQSDNLIYALEHDKPSDPMGYARRSASAFNTLWENTHD